MVAIPAQAQQQTITNNEGASEILSFENASQRKIYADLILELRCPKCQNQNIVYYCGLGQYFYC